MAHEAYGLAIKSRYPAQRETFQKNGRRDGTTVELSQLFSAAVTWNVRGQRRPPSIACVISTGIVVNFSSLGYGCCCGMYVLAVVRPGTSVVLLL